MPQDDGWDWPGLMYVATVVLRRTERQFWRMTPRKLNALVRAHIRLNDSKKADKPKRGFIDQVI